MADTAIDYAAALRELGFDPAWVARGVDRVKRETREGTYDGFRSMVTRLKIGGAFTALREHHVDPVVRRVEAQEAAARLAERGAQAALRTAAARAEEGDRVGAVGIAVLESNSRLVELLSQMTDGELDGRTPMRPEIAGQWRQLFPGA